MILLGDTLAMLVLGYEDTFQVTIDEMAHHIAAVARVRPRALVLGDLPWLSYHLSSDDAVLNAARLTGAGARAVKLEGGAKRVRVVAAIVDAEIPVCGHIGLTPQSIVRSAASRGKIPDAAAARVLFDDAKALVDAGVFAIVLEAVPDEVAGVITESVPVPTIGIGAGPHCDGRVLVFHDLLGLQDRLRPRFVRPYAHLKTDAVSAIKRYAADVRSGAFPADGESYHLSCESVATFGRDAAIDDDIRRARLLS